MKTRRLNFGLSALAIAAATLPCLVSGCTAPSNNVSSRRVTLREQHRMSAEQQILSRSLSQREQTLNILRDRVDELKPGESKRYHEPPPPPAEGPAYAQIPGEAPPDLSTAETRRAIENRDELIKALRARIAELENKKK